MHGISFKGASCNDTDFSGANLSDSDFSNKGSFDFLDTNFSKANLSKANFSNTDLCSFGSPVVNFTGANLTGTDFSNAKGLTEEQLIQAGWKRTAGRYATLWRRTAGRYEDEETPPILPDYLQDFDVERMGRVVRDDGPRGWKVIPS